MASAATGLAPGSTGVTPPTSNAAAKERRAELGARSHASLEEEEEEEEDSFQVRDLLVWSAEDSAARTPLQPRRGEARFAYREASFDAVGIFYTFCLFTLLAVAELVMKPHLEKNGLNLILQMQRDGTGAYVKFFDLFGFPPAIWGFMPAVALATAPVWRPVAARIMLLHGVGLVFQWALDIVFRQGRPFWIDKKVKMWHCPYTYGFPSGHALLLLLVVAPIVEELWARTKRPHSPWHTRTGSLLAFVGSSCLVTAYTICLVGRLYLGTHFLHSLLMGIVCGVLLLKIFTKHNTAILIDRIALSVELDGAASLPMRTFEIFLRAVGTALLLLCLCKALLAFCEHISAQDPDPVHWAERANRECNVTLHTMEGSDVKARDGIAIIVGWIAAVSLVVLRAAGVSTLIDEDDDDVHSPYDDDYDVEGIHRHNPHFKMSEVRTRRDSYGATHSARRSSLSQIDEDEEGMSPLSSSEAGGLNHGRRNRYRNRGWCNANFLIATSALCFQVGVNYMLAYTLHASSLGRMIAVILSLYAFPHVFFIQPVH